MDGGLIRLKEVLTGLKPSERKVAEYILAQPEQVIYSFCRAQIGGVKRSFGSYRDPFDPFPQHGRVPRMKLHIAGDLTKKSLSDSYQEIRMGDTVESIIAVSNNNQKSIHDTISLL